MTLLFGLHDDEPSIDPLIAPAPVPPPRRSDLDMVPAESRVLPDRIVITIEDLD